MCTHSLCFEQKYEKYQSFSSENFRFSAVIFSIYLNRLVFVMVSDFSWTFSLRFIILLFDKHFTVFSFSYCF